MTYAYDEHGFPNEHDEHEPDDDLYDRPMPGDDDYEEPDPLMAAWADDDERLMFANPGSALRAAGPNNPRVHPCPSCKTPGMLTAADRDLGYQCDRCADLAEGMWTGEL